MTATAAHTSIRVQFYPNVSGPTPCFDRTAWRCIGADAFWEAVAEAENEAAENEAPEEGRN